jgi:hypothetical protein
VGQGKENSYLIASYMIMFRPGLPKVGGQNTAWQHGIRVLMARGGLALLSSRGRPSFCIIQMEF